MSRGQDPARLRRRHRDAAAQTTVAELAVALAEGDLAGIRAVLRTDSVLIVDSGGRMPESSALVEGRIAASAALAALMTTGTAVVMASINSAPGFVIVRDDRVVAAVSAEARSGLLATVWVVCNPDKLRHWNLSVDG